MKLPRRHFLNLAAGAVALPALLRSARADTYPSRPVHLLVGFPPGGAADIIARLTGQMLSERLGQSFVVENRGSAGQQIAAEAVVNAPPDGYTLLLLANPNVINGMLNPNLSFNFTRDLAPVGGVDLNPLILEVHPSLPVKTVPELIAYAKAHPGELNMASGGVGSTPHLAGELFKMLTGIDMLHVPYRGDAPAVTDLLAGQDQVMFDLILLSLQPHPQRRIARPRRHQRKTPADAARFAAGGRFRAGLRSLRLARRRRPEGHAARYRRQAQRRDQCRPRRCQDRLAPHRPRRHADADDAGRFGKLIANEIEKWGKVIKFANIKPG